MRLYGLILTYLCIIEVIIGQLSDVVEETDKPVTSDDENTELDAGPVTEQVMEPNITMNEPGKPEANETEEPDDEETITDANWNANIAILDVAYFLRAHKFQDFDRRYFSSLDASSTRLYQGFPKPPLRSLHWEVHKNCDTGFHNCLRYLGGIVKSTSLRRQDDTVTIMMEHKWNVQNNTPQILAAQKDCQAAQRRDNLTVAPFQGPIERFQWRTSASYYMCWYTMLGTSELEFFGQPCSNHANCLDSYSVDNKDPRANDDKPFDCALYSFCPDHCCPMKHIWYMRDCFQSHENPCYEGNRPAERKCTLNREENQDFHSLINNHINFTCECRESGYEWSSRFGLCVDINECSRDMHNCVLDAGQICINQPGNHVCICNLGFVWSAENQSCIASPKIQKALKPAENEDDEDETPKDVKSALAAIVKAFTRSWAMQKAHESWQTLIFLQITSIVVRHFLAIC